MANQLEQSHQSGGQTGQPRQPHTSHDTGMPSGFHATTASAGTAALGAPATGYPYYYQQPYPYNYSASSQRHVHPPLANDNYSYSAPTAVSHQHEGYQSPHQRQFVPQQLHQYQRHNPRKRPHPSHYQQQQQQPRRLFKCEPCRLELDSATALEAHKASHIKCSACSFEAAPKVVKAHHQGVHGKFSGTGFKTVTIAVPGCPVQRFRICVGNRPSDVQRWIEERRKRFPRVKRNGADSEWPQEQGIRNTSGDNPNAESNVAPTKKEGLSNLLEGYGSSSSDDDGDDEGDNINCGKYQNKEPAEDDQDGESLAPKEQLQEETCLNRTDAEPKHIPPLCRFFARNGKCRHGDNCSFRHEVSSHGNHHELGKREGDSRQKYTAKSPEQSLLRKLLENDVRRERALTIQLLDHIVDTDFLQKPSSKPRPSSTH